LAEWFLKFLTEEDDLLLDPFGGSNSMDAVGEEIGRKGIAIEPMKATPRIEGRFHSSRVRRRISPGTFQRSLNCDCRILPYVGDTSLRRSNRDRPIDTKEVGL
jgi:hypothetical protein